MHRWGWTLIILLSGVVLLGRMGVWQALPSNEKAHLATDTISFLEGADYQKQLIADFTAAESSIFIALFACVLPDDASQRHPVRQLLDSLVDAHRRGVEVHVLFDYERRRDGSEDMVNHNAAEYLAQRAVPVRRSEPNRRAHMKTVVIDDVVVHIGSANWTWSAFRRNREHNLRVSDVAIASDVLTACMHAWDAASPQEELGH